MTWVSLGIAAAGVVAGGVQASNAANGAAIGGINSAIGQTELNTFTLQDNAAVNKVIGETNLQNTIRTGYRVGLINVQAGQAKRAALQQGVSLNRDLLQASSAAAANAAGAGSIGSSVNAVLSDIQQQAEEAEAGMIDSDRIVRSNYDQELHDAIVAGQDSLQSAATVSVHRVAQVVKASAAEIWGGAVIDGAAQYASSYMSLGLGKKKPGGP